MPFFNGNSPANSAVLLGLDLFFGMRFVSGKSISPLLYHYSQQYQCCFGMSTPFMYSVGVGSICSDSLGVIFSGY